jgi:hypothetical protein
VTEYRRKKHDAPNIVLKRFSRLDHAARSVTGEEAACCEALVKEVNRSPAAYHSPRSSVFIELGVSGDVGGVKTGSSCTNTSPVSGFSVVMVLGL